MSISAHEDEGRKEIECNMFYLRTNVSPTLQTNELCYHLLMIIGGLTTMLGTLQGGCLSCLCEKKRYIFTVLTKES
jgi:hypothetical protein